MTNGRPLDQTGFLLGRAYFSYLGLLERLLAETGLDQHCPPGLGNLLFALFEQDDQTITAIGDRLELSKSTMTGLIRRAKKQKLVTTSRDLTDGRAIRVKLTPLARSLEGQCNGLARRIDSTLTSRLSPRQLTQLQSLLGKLVTTINDEIGKLSEQKE